MYLRPIICWIHGWSSSPRVWAPVTQRLATARHTFPSFSAVAHADEFVPAVVDSLPQNHDVKNDLSDPPSTRSILVGWSLGGMVALDLAAADAAPVSGIVLFNTTARFVSRDFRCGWPDSALRRMKTRLKSGPDELIDEFSAGIFCRAETAKGADRGFRECLFDPKGDDHLAITTVGCLAGLDYLLATDLTESLGKIRCPVLWIHGNDDTVCPSGAFRLTQEVLADNDRFTFESWDATGHAAMWSNPERAALRIARFLNESVD